MDMDIEYAECNAQLVKQWGDRFGEINLFQITDGSGNWLVKMRELDMDEGWCITRKIYKSRNAAMNYIRKHL